MNEPQAYRNGEFIPASSLSVPVYDAGLVLGAAVTEQLRTFGGRLFEAERHIGRLRRSLEVVGVKAPVEFDQLTRDAHELAARNHRLLAEGDDLGLCLFVTPGAFATMAPADAGGPLAVMRTYPLPFGLWAEKYRSGQSLVTVDTRQVPAACWPSELKCRSRMHYYLADQQARRKQPDARAIMLDDQERVLEATSANIVACYGDELCGPPRQRVLPGVSLATVESLARELGWRFCERDLTVAELQSADEVWLTSTTCCALPVTRIEGQPIGNGVPGAMHAALMERWSELVGMPIMEQAWRFARRGV